ncbi:MAG: hypothetical protein D6706_21010, partial [Chloroflexi bacterium]
MLTTVPAYGQIQITRQDLVYIGDSIPRASDTLPLVSGTVSGGANVIWDFSNVVADVNNVTAVIAPAGTPYGSDFPNSNIAMTVDGSNFLYFNYQNTQVTLDGFAGDDPINLGSTISVPFDPVRFLNALPVTFGSVYTGNYGFEVEVNGASFGVQSIRLVHNATFRDTVKGYGKIILPTGTYDCLLITSVENATDEVWVKPFFPPTWTHFQTTTSTTKSHTWLAKETKLPVAELAFDSLGNPSRFTWTLIPPRPVASFSVTGNANGVVTFSNNSTNPVDAYWWDFGDGTVDSSANPGTHVYCTDGIYTVCLYASNISGVDSTCQQVTVTGTLTVNSSSNDPLCNGGQDGSITLTASGGTPPYTYQWNNGATASMLSSLPAGVYMVTVYDNNSCSRTLSFTLQEPAALQVTVGVTNVSSPGASDGTIDLTVSGGTPPYSYQWSDGSTGEDLTGLPAGNYCVTVTDANGCSLTRCTIVGTSGCVVEIDSVRASRPCFGLCNGMIDVVGVVSSSGSVSYSIDGGNSYQSSPQFAGLCAGVYILQVYDSAGCYDVDTVPLVSDEPDLTLTQSGDTLFASTDFAAYQWFHNGQSLPNATRYFLIPADTGSYYVELIDSAGCTYYSDTVVVLPSAVKSPGNGDPVVQVFPNPVNRQITVYLNV